MKEFVCGIMVASMVTLLTCSAYELGRAQGRREIRKDEKRISDEVIKILETVRKKMES